MRFEGEARIVGGVLELAMSKVREEMGRLSPSQSVSAFRLSSLRTVLRANYGHS